MNRLESFKQSMFPFYGAPWLTNSCSTLADQLARVIMGFWVFTIIFLGANFIYMDSEGQYWVKGMSQWLDIPVHIAYMQHFISTPASEWFSVHPLNIEQVFTYHFLSDLISAGLYKLGFNIQWSLALPVIVASVGFILEAYMFFKARSGSAFHAAMVVTSVLLFGGFGFIYRLINPEYFLVSGSDSAVFTIEGLGLSAMPNVLTGMLFAQRGLPIGLWAMFMSLRIFFDKAPRLSLVYILVLNAIMMLSLIHASMVFHLYMGVVFLFSPSRKIFFTICAIFIESIIIFLIFYSSSLGGSYIGIISGFYFSVGDHGFQYVVFWGLSTFLLLPLYFYCLLRDKKIDQDVLFVLIILFIVNFIQFQPNVWDNIKFLVLGLPFIYAKIWRLLLSATPRFSLGRYLIAVCVGFSLWGSGIVDLVETMQGSRLDYRLYSQAEEHFSEELQSLIPADSSVIIENKHNHFALQLLPQHTLLGFQFNMDTYGYDYLPLQRKINAILLGERNKEFLSERNVAAIIVKKGEQYNARERSRLGYFLTIGESVDANEGALRDQYPILLESEHYAAFSTEHAVGIHD